MHYKSENILNGYYGIGKSERHPIASKCTSNYFWLVLCVCVCVRVCLFGAHSSLCFCAEQLFPILKHSPCAEADIGLMKRSIFHTRHANETVLSFALISVIVYIQKLLKFGMCLSVHVYLSHSHSHFPSFESTGLKISYKIVDSLCNAYGIVCNYCFQAKVSLILRLKDSLLLHRIKMSRQTNVTCQTIESFNQIIYFV